MIELEEIANKWWRWWSNPFEELHPDRIAYLESKGVSFPGKDRYELVSKARRALNLPVVPDEVMVQAPKICLAVLIDEDTLHKKLAGLGCLALADSILTTRNQDWADLYGVHDSVMIRDLVSTLRNLTPALEIIRLAVINVDPLMNMKSLRIQDAINLVLGIYFREFSQSLYKRWVLTVSVCIESILNQVPRVHKDHLVEFQQWVDARLIDLIEEFKSAQEIPKIDLNELSVSHVEATQEN